MFQGRSQEGKGRQPYRAARIAFWHFAGLRKRIGSDGLAARAAAVCGAPITSTPCGLGGIAAHQRGCTNTRGAVSRRTIGGAASPTRGQRRTRLAVTATRLHRCLCARRATCPLRRVQLQRMGTALQALDMTALPRRGSCRVGGGQPCRGSTDRRAPRQGIRIRIKHRSRRQVRRRAWVVVMIAGIEAKAQRIARRGTCEDSELLTPCRATIAEPVAARDR